MPSWSWKPGRHLWNDHPFTSDFLKAILWEVFDPPNDWTLIAPMSLLGFSILSQELSGSFHVVVSGSPAVCLHLFPLSPNSFGLPVSQFICLPVWLMVSPDVSQFICLSSLVSLHVSPSLACGVQLFGRLSLLVSPYLSSDVSVHLSPFICLPVWQEVFGSRYFSELISLHLSSNVPILVSGSSDVSLHLSPFICLPSCLVVIGCPALWMSFSISSVLQCA